MLRRYAPMKQGRGTVIPGELRIRVLERDRGCVGPRVGMDGDCFGRLELDHISASGAMGKKSPTEDWNLCSMCSTHHLEKTLHGRRWRPVLLGYVAGVSR